MPYGQGGILEDQKIMSRPRSYHGGSTSSLSMTGDPRNWFVDGTTTGFVKMVGHFHCTIHGTTM